MTWRAIMSGRSPASAPGRMATTARRASASAASMASPTSSLRMRDSPSSPTRCASRLCLSFAYHRSCARPSWISRAIRARSSSCALSACASARRCTSPCASRSSRRSSRLSVTIPPSSTPVEGQPQEVAGGDHGGVAAGVDGAVDLAGGGDQQARRQQRVPGPAAAAVGPMRQQRGDEERGADHALDGDEHRSQPRRQWHRRELDQLVQGSLGGQLRQPVLRQRRQDDRHADERRRRDEHDGGPGAGRRAVERQGARQDEEDGGWSSAR